MADVKEILLSNEFSSYDEILLVCHSYGCTIGALLAPALRDVLKGAVLCGPKGEQAAIDVVLRDKVSFLILCLTSIRWLERATLCSTSGDI